MAPSSHPNAAAASGARGRGLGLVRDTVGLEDLHDAFVVGFDPVDRDGRGGAPVCVALGVQLQAVGSIEDHALDRAGLDAGLRVRPRETVPEVALYDTDHRPPQYHQDDEIQYDEEIAVFGHTRGLATGDRPGKDGQPRP